MKEKLTCIYIGNEEGTANEIGGSQCANATKNFAELQSLTGINEIIRGKKKLDKWKRK